MGDNTHFETSFTQTLSTDSACQSSVFKWFIYLCIFLFIYHLITASATVGGLQVYKTSHNKLHSAIWRDNNKINSYQKRKNNIDIKINCIWDNQLLKLALNNCVLTNFLNIRREGTWHIYSRDGGPSTQKA